tara:strand:- start:2130 stop:2549 length:420 start_codon:yes stop_codon:yes gene_type:complete
MKNFILTFILLVYSVSLTAQDYAVVLNAGSRIEKDSPLNKFTLDILSNKEFKYRDFLKQSKSSKVNFHLNGNTFTKTELTKLLRKSVRSAGSYKEFKPLFENTYPKFLRVLSDKDMTLLYEKFRKGTLNTYIQNLAEEW